MNRRRGRPSQFTSRARLRDAHVPRNEPGESDLSVDGAHVVQGRVPHTGADGGEHRLGHLLYVRIVITEGDPAGIDQAITSGRATSEVTIVAADVVREARAAERLIPDDSCEQVR
jgi:hypothetical protein